MSVATLKQITESGWFNNTIRVVILLAGICVGMETSPRITRHWGVALSLINDLILWIFVIEAAMKIAAEGRKPWRYLKDPWNVFDFTIVAVCFMPFNAQYIAVLRLLRLLRVLKLVRTLPRLQVLVGALLNAIPSMGYVSLLLFMLFYVYAVSAVFLFGANDPVHFANLPLALLSLFRVVTGAGWTDVMYIQMYGCDGYGYGGIEELCTQPEAYPVFGAIFFVSFMLFGAMVMLNLFIGVIMNSMDESEKEQAMVKRMARANALSVDEDCIETDLELLQSQLQAFQETLEAIQYRVSQAGQKEEER
jgi:voltage-gated sodium channel